MHISIMTSSMDQSDTFIPPIEVIHHLKGYGFTHLDLFLARLVRNQGSFLGDDWREEAHALKEEADRIGVVFNQSHAPFFLGAGAYNPANVEFNDFFKKMLLRCIEINAIVGSPTTVVHPLTPPDALLEDTEALMQENLDFYREALEFSVEKGVSLAFENMGKIRYGGRVTDLIELVDSFSQYNAGICWDIGHGALAYEDQCWALDKLHGRITAIHVQDNKGVGDDHLLPFLGTIDWYTIMPKLKEIGFTGDLVLELAQSKRMIAEALDLSMQLQAIVAKKLVDIFHGEA
jgi:sugar phosphate isomerase/epimerase